MQNTIIRKLIIVRGLPGSGKSTLAKHLVESSKPAETFYHLETDHYFTDDLGNYKWDRSQLHNAHRHCQLATKKLLSIGFSVVVSNTFITCNELKPYFEIAHKFNITPSVIICQNQFENIHSVPDETLLKMKQSFEFDISKLFNDILPMDIKIKTT